MDKIKEIYADSIYYFYNSPYRDKLSGGLFIGHMQLSEPYREKIPLMYQIQFHWDLGVSLYFRKVGYNSCKGVLVVRDENMGWTSLNVDTSKGQEGVIGLIMGVEEHLMGKYCNQ